LASICKSTAAPPTAGWISLQTADSTAAPDSSTSTSRRASSRGLGYFYSTSWVAARFKCNSGHILQDDPSIREEVLDSRLGAPCHVSFGFFFGFCRIFLPKLQMDPQPEFTTQPKARGLLHMECDFAITLPYQLRLQDNTALLKTFKSSTRGRLGLLEKTSGLLKHQLEYIPASGCFNYSWGLLTCSAQGRLRTTR
jgi:hypothetical protein